MAQKSNFGGQVLTLRSLFVAMASVQLVTAASGTLVALYFAETGASQEAAALAPACYSLGFLVGCFYIARWITDIGHIRSFAAGSAVCIASALLFSLSEPVPALLLARFLTGLATAGLYAIGDAWISETADKNNRGRLLGIYAIVLGSMSVASQLLIQILPGDLNRAFIIVSLLYCLAIVVLTAARTDPPSIGSSASVRLKSLFTDSPTALIGALTVGMVATSILNVLPYRAAILGISTTDIALGIAALYVGRILFMYPLMRASDRGDRRLIILTTGAIATALLLTVSIVWTGDGTAYRAASGTAQVVILGLIVLLGGSLLTMYSLLVAHALDRTVPVYVASSSVTMLFATTIGGVVGPLASSAISATMGDMAVTWMLFAMMACFSMFVAARIRRKEAVPRAEKATNVIVDATSVETITETKRPVRG